MEMVEQRRKIVKMVKEAWEKRLEDGGFCKDKEREIDIVIVDDENGGQERLNVFGGLSRKLIILF